MLARNWKTAEELGITEDQKLALITALHGFERNEFEDFTMGSWCRCIYGQATRAAADAESMIPLMHKKSLSALFIPDPGILCDKKRTYDSLTQEEAANALRGWLTTGEANWGEALSPVVPANEPSVSKDILELV